MNAKTTARAAGWCLLLIVLPTASPVSAEAPAASKPLQERYLQAIDQEIQRTRRLLRLEMETQETDDVQRLALLRASQEELRRLEARLERWEKRQDLEPYRRNFPRFLRSVHSQLRRLKTDLDSLARSGEAASYESGRTPGALAEWGHSAEKARVPKPHSLAAENRAGRAASQPTVPSNDDCGLATAIGDGLFEGNTESATNDGEASCGAAETSPDVWFRYTAGTSGTVDFNTLGSSFDTVLSLHTSCPGTTTNQLACNDDWNSLQSRLTHEMSMGEEVVVRVSGFYGDTGDFQLNVGQPGQIVGRVVDEATGQGLANVDIDLYFENGYWVDDYWTGATGAYSIVDLSPGTYYVKANKAYYFTELYDDIPCYEYCDPTTGSPISVGRGETVQVDFALQLGGWIEGTVIEAQTGRPLDDAQVSVYDESGGLVEDGWTDGVGGYAVSRLSSGTYFAVAHRWNYTDVLYDDIACPAGCDPTIGTPIEVSVGEATEGIDFALDREGAISGVVLDEAIGFPVSYCDVDVWNQQGGWVGYGWGNFWGNYTAGGLPAGTYHVTTDNDTGYFDELYDDFPCVWGGCDPRSGTAIEVETGMNTTGVDFHLMLGGSITGSVTDVATGSPVEGRVEVISANGEKVGESWIDDGRYLLSGLPTADYFVRTHNLDGYTDGVYDGIFCPSDCDPTTGTPVGVVAGFTTTGIDFELCGPPVVEPHFPPSADPQSFIVRCLVQIGGTSAPYHPGCPAIERIFWDWGDGKRGYRPMPARHFYTTFDGGLVTISVTAYDFLGGESATVQGEIELRNCRPRGFR